MDWYRFVAGFQRTPIGNTCESMAPFSGVK
jgi:hypothetical protein